MSVNLHSELGLAQSSGTYKLVELNDELLAELRDKESDSRLQFKSLDKEGSHVVLCSSDKTWVVRQKDHSNLSMLMREDVVDTERVLDPSACFGLPPPISDYIGYARTTYEYETIKTEGQLSLDNVPVYNGGPNFQAQEGDKPALTFEDLVNNSPTSRKEALDQWHRLAGCMVAGQACLLSATVLHKALHVTLMSVLAESMDLDAISLDGAYTAVSKDMDETFNPYSESVVETVLNRFGKVTSEPGQSPKLWSLNRTTLATWYGVFALKKYAAKTSVPVDEFMLQWKSTFPPFLTCDIDTNMLRGHFFHPQAEQLQYISRDTLPGDAKERFRTLFKLQSSWDMQDLEPFIADLNTKHLKIDSFVMKYARRRKVGKNVIVTSRS